MGSPKLWKGKEAREGREEGRGQREEGRGKWAEGRGKREGERRGKLNQGGPKRPRED